jgi:virginiamycin B lyase
MHVFSLRNVWLGAVSLAVVASIAACGGTSNVNPPTGNGAGTTNDHVRRTLGTAKIVIRIPRKKKKHHRGEKYVSASTQSLVVSSTGQANQTFNLTPSSPGCKPDVGTGDLTCSDTAYFPSGQQSIAFSLYDLQDGKGNQLSTASTTVKILSGATTTIPITLDGVVASAVVTIAGSASTSVPQGTATSVPVTVSAYDADKNLIIAPGDYSSPIALTDSDASGATNLSVAQVASPGAPVSLSYDGSTLATALITPVVGGVAQSAGSASISGIVLTPTVVEYPLPTTGDTTAGIVQGADGAMWFTEEFNLAIGRIDAGGNVTEYSGMTGGQPLGIAAGPDGALWFAEFKFTGGPPPLRKSYVGRITTDGTLTEYATPSTSAELVDIAVGPDGNLWFTEYAKHQIGQITTSGSITEFPLPSGGDPNSITNGPDDALWFTETGSDQIGRIATDGTVTEYTSAVTPLDKKNGTIASGPDHELWFTGTTGCCTAEIGNFATSGSDIAVYPLPTNPPADGSPTAGGIVASNGTLWFSFASNAGLLNSSIGRITTSGVVTMTQIPTLGSQPAGIAVGTGGLWYTDDGTTSAQIGQVQLPVGFTSRRHEHTPAKPTVTSSDVHARP